MAEAWCEQGRRELVWEDGTAGTAGTVVPGCMSMAASAALGVLVLGHDTRPGLTVCDLDWTREAALLPRTVLQDHFVQHSQCEYGCIQVRFLQQDPSNLLVVTFTCAGGRFGVQLVDVVTATVLVTLPMPTLSLLDIPFLYLQVVPGFIAVKMVQALAPRWDDVVLLYRGGGLHWDLVRVILDDPRLKQTPMSDFHLGFASAAPEFVICTCARCKGVVLKTVFGSCVWAGADVDSQDLFLTPIPLGGYESLVTSDGSTCLTTLQPFRKSALRYCLELVGVDTTWPLLLRRSTTGVSVAHVFHDCLAVAAAVLPDHSMVVLCSDQARVSLVHLMSASHDDDMPLAGRD